MGDFRVTTCNHLSSYVTYVHLHTSLSIFLDSSRKKIPPLVCGWLWFQTYFRFLSGILWIDMSQLEKGPKKDAQNGSPKKDLLQSAVARAWHLDTPILWWIFFLLPIFLVQILMARLLFLNLLSFQQEKHVNGIIDPHFCLFGPTFDRWNLHFDRWKPTFFEGEIPYLCLVIAEFWRLLQHPPCRRKFFARHLPWDDVWRGIDPRHFGRDAQENVMDLNDHCCWWFFWCSQFPTVEKIRTFPKIAYLLDTFFLGKQVKSMSWDKSQLPRQWGRFCVLKSPRARCLRRRDVRKSDHRL